MKKERKRQKKKTLLSEKFLEFYIYIRVLTEYKQVKIHFLIINFIIILSTIQELSFLFLNYDQDSHGNTINFMTFIKTICRASRLRFGSDLLFEKTSYLIPLTITLAYQLLLLIIFANFILKQKKQQRLGEFLKTENRLLQILLRTFTFFHSLMHYVTIVPMAEMTFESIFTNASSKNLNILHLAISIITLLLVISDYLIQLFCNLESISICPKNFQVLQVTFSNYWTSLCNILVILIDQMGSTQITKFYLIFSIILVKEISVLWTFIWNFPNLFQRSQIILACNSFQVTVSFILFINKLSDFQPDYFDTLLLLTICPIVIEAILNWHRNQNEKIMVENNMRCTADMQQYKIANIIHEYGNLQQNYIENPKKIMTLQYYFVNHQEECEDSKCSCRKQSSFISFEDIIYLHLKDSVKQFDNQISKSKDEAVQQSYFLHYLSLVNYLGLNTKAFQQSNFLLQLDSEQLQYSSSATQHMMNFKSVSQRNDKREINSSSDGKSKSIQKQQSNGEKLAATATHLKLRGLGIIQRQKLAIIQDKVKQSMSMGFQRQSMAFSENLEHAVKLFLSSEESNKKLRNKVIKMINRKREFFTNINQINNDVSLFQTGRKLLIRMTSLESALSKLYDQFPSQKMQALNTFYQSEIMNNYFSAYKIATIASISDEKLLKMQSQTSFDLFSNKIDYLIIGFDQTTHKLSIRNGSNLIHQFFGCSLEQFRLISSIDSFLPSGFDYVHDRLVANFLQNGQSKYFRQINLNFTRFQQKFIKPVDFFYDINFMNLDDLTFVCFLQNNETQNAYIFCQQNYKIIGVTKNLIHKLGYNPKLNKEFVQSFLKIYLGKVFPKIMILLEANLTKASDHNQDVLETTQISEYGIQMFAPQSLLLENDIKVNWDNPDNLTQFNVDCILHLKNFRSDLNYLILEIKEIKKYLKTENTTPEPQLTLGLNSNQLLESFNDYEVEQEDVEFAINLPKAIELYGLDDQTDHLKNFDNSDNYDNFENINTKLKMNERSMNNSYQQQPFVNQSMMSPKDSGLRLIDQKNPDFNVTVIKGKKTERQQFFSSAEQVEQEDYSSSQNNQTSEVKKKQVLDNQIDKLQLDDIDQDLQENIKLQMQMDTKEQRIVHIDDMGSQVSSIAGLKKSKYSKKYDLIERLITSTVFSRFFQLVLLFFTLMLILFLIYSGVMLYYSNNDLNRFLQELDMIQIKANIIGPINKYIVSQNALTNYVILPLLYQNITMKSQLVKMQYATNDINYTYYDLKDSFTSQLSNPYLNPFFEDKYFSILFGNYPSTNTYNISARESMYLYLEASYNFVKIDYANIINLDLASTFLVFLYGNYQTFLDQLRLLNQEMLQYSIERSYNVRDNWTSLLVPILITCFLLMLISFYFYKFYLAQYNNFLSLFGLIDVVWLQRDIDRYRGIASLLIKDSDVLFKYQFDIEIKEKFLAAEDIRKEKIAQNQRNSKQKSKTQMNQINQKMSIYPSLLLFSFIFGICFIFCFITNSQGRTYFSKYPDTTTFFNSLSDLCVAISGVFAMRELTYYQKYPTDVFYFLPDKKATFFVENFLNQIAVINDFLALVSQFDSSKYITSDSFVGEMQQMMESDVCQFLPSYKIELAQNHCDAVYQGVLRRGFQAAAATIRDSLLNEFSQTEEFVLKSYTIQEELEAGLIGYDAISALKHSFQTQLTTSTDQLILQILIINLVFIILIVGMAGLAFTKILLHFEWEFNLMKRFVLLLPQQSLFLDSQLDRTLRQMIVRDQLI